MTSNITYKNEEANIGSVEARLTLFEGVLNDDEIECLKSQYVYTGRNNARYKITFYTFANEWSDKKNERYFKTIENALKWYKKNMLDRVILQGGAWLTEDGGDGEEEAEIKKLIDGDYNTALDKMTEEQKTRCIEEWEMMTLYCEI